MTTHQIATAETGKKVTIKSIVYTIVRTSEKIVWLKREGGKQVYMSSYFTKNGQTFINGLPRAI